MSAARLSVEGVAVHVFLLHLIAHFVKARAMFRANEPIIAIAGELGIP
jgi:hypothetical protein